MYNAASKTLTLAIALLALASCGKADPDQAAAQELVGRIDQLMQSGAYTQALELMDSVDQLYPSQIASRKQVMAMRPQAIEQVTIERIAYADSLIAATQLELQQLEPLMKHISGDDLEGYYVVADAYDPNFINTTAFEPRVNDHDYRYYIVANNNGKKLGIDQVALVTGADECRSQQMPATSERTMTVETSEIASFLPEEVDSLGAWAYDHKTDIKGGVIYGSKGSAKVNLKPKQAAAFGTAWRYANEQQRLRSAMILREKLDRQLQISRDQAANTQQAAQ